MGKGRMRRRGRRENGWGKTERGEGELKVVPSFGLPNWNVYVMALWL
jgi:hypothetical protein